MANANDIEKGMRSDIMVISVWSWRKKGLNRVKAGAFVQTVLRNLRTGRTSQTRFASSETVEVVPLIRKKLEYSYRDGSGYIFMDTETYDQITIPAELVDPFKDYVVEGTGYDIVFTEDDIPMQLDLPPSVILEVIEAPEGLRGDSATNVRKPVKLETGLELNVPLFIKEGEQIKIDTRSGEYMGRAG